MWAPKAVAYPASPQDRMKKMNVRKVISHLQSVMLLESYFKSERLRYILKCILTNISFINIYKVSKSFIGLDN